jgi:hypothetical protein
MADRRLTPSQRECAAAWWKAGVDTFDIAKILSKRFATSFTEAQIYNSVFHPHSRDAVNVVPLRAAKAAAS